MVVIPAKAAKAGIQFTGLWQPTGREKASVLRTDMGELREGLVDSAPTSRSSVLAFSWRASFSLQQRFQQLLDP
jgi:hypothetical protein